jgi:hypothetical protein
MMHAASKIESGKGSENIVRRAVRSSLRLRLLSGASSLGLLATAIAGTERAHADCSPNSPVNNTTVTCSGTTTSSGLVGYGIFTDTGNTINVVSGASVSARQAGLVFGDGTVNNFGLIEATGAGISGSASSSAIAAIGDLLLHNMNGGTIQGNATTGAGGSGVFANGTATVDNGTGIITGNNAGIFASTTNVTANAGTIAATGAGGVAISGSITTVTNNSGTIQANGVGGIAITSSFGGPGITVTNNTGTIQANGGADVNNVGGVAISGGTVKVTGNAGKIEATGAGGAAIVADTATVDNLAGGIGTVYRNRR